MDDLIAMPQPIPDLHLERVEPLTQYNVSQLVPNANLRWQQRADNGADNYIRMYHLKKYKIKIDGNPCYIYITKNKRTNVRGMTWKKLHYYRHQWQHKIGRVDNKISSITKDIQNAQKSIDAFNDAMESNVPVSKTNYFKQNQRNETRIAKLRSSIAKAKSSKAQAHYKQEIAQLQEQNVANVHELSYIEVANAHADLKRKSMNAGARIKTDKQALKALKKQLRHDNRKWGIYTKEINRRIDVGHKRTQAKNSRKISRAVKQNNKMGYSSIYRTDKMSADILGIPEFSPTVETNINLPTQPIDNHAPQINFAEVSGRTISGEYWIKSTSRAERDHQYAILENWIGAQLTIAGFTHWKQVFLSSMSKDPNKGSTNSYKLSLTFSDARVAKVMYAREKKHIKRKAHINPTHGRNNGKKIKIRPGMTFWSISRRFNIPIATLMHNNRKYKAKALPIGGRITL